MTKKKAELRSSPISMSVHRYGQLDSLKSGAKTNWKIQSLQPFFPPIEKLFKTELVETPSACGIRFHNEIQSILSESTIRTTNGSVRPVHKKVSMLLSPYKWMQGDYGVTLGLPGTTEQATRVQHGLQNHNTAGYVGAIFSSAFSQTKCPHFPEVFGVFTGIAERHQIDISDDYGDLCNRSWFSQNIGKTFDIHVNSDVADATTFSHTRSARLEIQLGDEITLDDIPEVEGIQSSIDTPAELGQFTHELSTDDEDCESDSSSVSTSYIFEIESCDCDDEEQEEFIDEEESGEPFAFASFENVPVQVTVMEQCDGTFYKLLVDHPETEKHLAWFAQVIFGLAYAQRVFGFVHNDLHANNVMYVPTTDEYLYYNCGGAFYKVPTYGYLIKLIDFERGLGSIKIAGMKDPKFFMSNHFSVDEEAGGQYNFEPYFVSKIPHIKPNPSFDLVRLATSLFWDLFPEGPNCTEYSENPVYKMMMRWLTIEDGSILFGKKDPRHDRFHGFDLYKAIARFCKDTAVPRREIDLLKDDFKTTEIPVGVSVCGIDV